MKIEIQGYTATCTHDNGGVNAVNFGVVNNKLVFDKSVNFDLRSRIRKEFKK